MLNHQVLLNKLECYGLCGPVLDWFRSYISGRSLTAKVTTAQNTVTFLDCYNITYGTAQGSCLGGLILSADDTSLLNHYHNKGFLEYAMNHDMDNQLSLNLLKIVLMCFWNNKPDITVTVDSLSIPNVTFTKFLGVFVDQKLSWEEHVTRLLDKLLINKHLLMVSSNLLDKSSLKLTCTHTESSGIQSQHLGEHDKQRKPITDL